MKEKEFSMDRRLFLKTLAIGSGAIAIAALPVALAGGGHAAGVTPSGPGGGSLTSGSYILGRMYIWYDNVNQMQLTNGRARWQASQTGWNRDSAQWFLNEMNRMVSETVGRNVSLSYRNGGPQSRLGDISHYDEYFRIAEMALEGARVEAQTDRARVVGVAWSWYSLTPDGETTYGLYGYDNAWEFNTYDLFSAETGFTRRPEVGPDFGDFLNIEWNGPYHSTLWGDDPAHGYGKSWVNHQYDETVQFNPDENRYLIVVAVADDAPLSLGSIELYKRTVNPEITNDNENYIFPTQPLDDKSLKNIPFRIYGPYAKESDITDSIKATIRDDDNGTADKFVTSMVTDSNGYWKKDELDSGWYAVIESSNDLTGFIKNDNVYVTEVKPGETSRVNS